jgi:ABC-type branched-subunit amino acid transport system permease subunit
VPIGWIGGGLNPVRVPRPVIGPWDLSDGGSWFLFCLVILVIVSVLVIFLRRGTTGHFLDALRGSPTASQSIGINPSKMTILAFALSAGIAGLGGGLLAMHAGAANKYDYAYTYGLVFVVLVVSTASRTVEGAINAAMAYTIIPYILQNWFDVTGAWVFVLFGFGAIQYARHPEGTLEAGKRRSLAFFQRQIDRVARRRERTGPDTESGEPAVAPDLAPVGTAGTGSPGSTAPAGAPQ